MPTETLAPVLRHQFFGNDGKPLNGGKLFSYIAGTTTKQGTFQDAAGASPNTNPIILNFRGEAIVFIPPNVGYKFVLAPSTDTDPPTNPIWSQDNVTNSQLLTLYGGVDTGVVNAYVLNFVANFTAYADGILINWIPANTNTGPSTINVNGLGPVAITNQDGSVLTSNQIIANQVATIMFKGGAFLLISSGLPAAVSSGTFAPAWTGFGGAPPTGNMFWQVTGKQVLMQWQGTQGVSNANFMTIGNLPGNLRPVTKDLIAASATTLINNGAYAVGSFGFGALGVMQFNIGTAPPSGVGFTAAGNKGLPTGWCGTYSLS